MSQIGPRADIERRSPGPASGPACHARRDDPHFKAKLAAKAQLATAQITAQSRADKTMLKGEIAADSYYDELKAALEKYQREHPSDASMRLAFHLRKHWRSMAIPGVVMTPRQLGNCPGGAEGPALLDACRSQPDPFSGIGAWAGAISGLFPAFS